MKRIKLYLDTSVPSAYFDERDTNRMAITRNFWTTLNNYDAFISDIVVREIQQIKSERRMNEMLELVSELNFLRSDEQSDELAEKYMNKGIFPVKKRDDAHHIAIATVHNIDYIVSWNYRHMVKTKTKEIVNQVNKENQLKNIDIVSPLEF